MKKIIVILFLCLIFQPCCYAKSKYTKNFIRNFSTCQPFTEARRNIAYNSIDTYEIVGYMRDGSGRCTYVETNEWLRGKFITTCNFEPKQHNEYYSAMLNPDVKKSVLIRGMAFVDANENAVYLKYYNMPSVCTTKRVR